MKIQFDPNLDFQHDAINAAVDLFDSQEVCQTMFSAKLIDQSG
jgi:type III restriction enzyme